jgi:chromosome segregation ATPase
MLEPLETGICAHLLFQRVTENWKVILMDCSTIISVSSFVISFLTGAPLLCSAFAIAAIASGVAAFYMRKFSALSDLEKTAQGLQISKEKLERIAGTLEKENKRLTESNRELQRNIESFRTNNQTLIQTNTQLTRQVTELTLQITQLQENAERIHQEVSRFQQENGHLHVNVRLLEQHILNARSLSNQISIQLASQQQGLGEQLEQLKRYLVELAADNRVHDRIQQLATLQTQSNQARDQLHRIQLQYAQELAKFQTIHDALLRIRDQFNTAIGEARSNNDQLRINVDALGRERQRIHELLNATQRTEPLIRG